MKKNTKVVKFKRRIKFNTLPKILLVISCFVVLISLFCVKTFAYSYDSETGNLISDNVLDVPQTFDIATVNNSSNPTQYGAYVNPSTEYTFTFTKTRIDGITVSNYTVYNFRALFYRTSSSSSSNISTQSGSTVNSFNSTFSVSYTFTTPSTCYYILVDFGNNNGDTNVNTRVTNAMIFESSKNLTSYEPYGVEWYSSNSYYDYGQDMYDSGVASVTTMFSRCNGVIQYISGVSSTYDDWDDWYNTFSWLGNGDNTGFVRIQNGGLVFYWNNFVNQGYGSMGDTYNLQFSFEDGNYPSTAQFNYYKISGSNCYLQINTPSSQAYKIISNSYSFPTDGGVSISSINIYNGQVGVGSSNMIVTTTNDTLTAYNNGYTVGEEYGYMYGYEAAKDEYYDVGYSAGYSAGASSSNPLGTLIFSVAETPWVAFKNIWSFDILGFNIANFVFGLITVLVVIWFLKKVK